MNKDLKDALAKAETKKISLKDLDLSGRLQQAEGLEKVQHVFGIRG